MPIDKDAFLHLSAICAAAKVTLVAVSKTKPVEDILALYELGHRDFGENYVQELTDKQTSLPVDIRWHFIGHLQSNKVKYIAPFVHLIHGVDSLKLLQEIHKQGSKVGRVIDCLVQIHIAREETKFGLDEEELESLMTHPQLAVLSHIHLAGFMGMASFSDDKAAVRSEFARLKQLFDQWAGREIPNCGFRTLSMGMSNDYPIAIEEGTNMIRIGSLLFGSR